MLGTLYVTHSLILGTHYKYSYEDISDMIADAQQVVASVLSTPLPPPPRMHTPTWLTQLTDVWLIHSLAVHGVSGLRVVVFGSTSPWYESLLLAMGALSVTTIEVKSFITIVNMQYRILSSQYNQLTYNHPNMTTVLVSDIGTFPSHFHRALSLSSFDHDGLGRYGDPINPDGDIDAMETTKTVLTDDGVLFLTVPIGTSQLDLHVHVMVWKGLCCVCVCVQDQTWLCGIFTVAMVTIVCRCC